MLGDMNDMHAYV